MDLGACKSTMEMAAAEAAYLLGNLHEHTAARSLDLADAAWILATEEEAELRLRGVTWLVALSLLVACSIAVLVLNRDFFLQGVSVDVDGHLTRLAYVTGLAAAMVTVFVGPLAMLGWLSRLAGRKDRLAKARAAGYDLVDRDEMARALQWVAKHPELKAATAQWGERGILIRSAEMQMLTWAVDAIEKRDLYAGFSTISKLPEVAHA